MAAFTPGCCCGVAGCTKGDCTDGHSTVTVTISGTAGTFCGSTSCGTTFDGSYILDFDTVGLGTHPQGACTTIPTGDDCYFIDEVIFNCSGLTDYKIAAFLMQNAGNYEWVVRIISVGFGTFNVVYYTGGSTTTPCDDLPVTLNKVATGGCSSGTCTFPATITLAA